MQSSNSGASATYFVSRRDLTARNSPWPADANTKLQIAQPLADPNPNPNPGAPCSRLLFASAPLREAVQQPGNAAAAATAPQAVVEGLRRAAEDTAAAPEGARVRVYQR